MSRRQATILVAAAGSAGGVLLTQTVRVSGLDGGLWQAMTGWRKPFAVHDPGKVLTDLAVALTLGGDCLADAGLLRSEPELFARVGSEATISRTITALAHDADVVLTRIGSARRAARERVWALASQHSPLADASAEAPLVIDLLTSHSEKEQSAATIKRGFGSTRCARSLTTAARAPGSCSRSCCGRGTPGRTPPRPHRPDEAGTGCGPGHRRLPASSQGTDPCRWQRRHQGVRQIPDPPGAVLLARVHTA